MSTKAKFFQMAETADCDVDYGRTDGMVWCVVWAPDGQEFASSSCACDASFNTMTTPSGGAIDWPVACAALNEILADGFQECA